MGHSSFQILTIPIKWEKTKMDKAQSGLKPFPVTMQMVIDAHRKVKTKGKAYGVDEVSLKDFEQKLNGNLYKIWNRLASGTYFPPAVREVEIPKKDGKMRNLGIPTIGDRIAQTVVKDYMEASIDKLFHEDSYGYRPLKSAHQALAKARINVRKYDWVIDMDIKGFFDNIDHELILKALDKVVEEKMGEDVLQTLARNASSKAGRDNSCQRRTRHATGRCHQPFIGQPVPTLCF